MTTYAITLAAIIAVAFIGMIIAAKKQSSNSLAKPAVIICTLTILIAGSMLIIDRMAPADMHKLIDNKLIFLKSAGYGTARYFNDTCKVRQAVVIVSEKLKNSPDGQALLDGLEKGFGADILVTAVLPEPVQHAKDKKSVPLFTCRYPAASFNKILRRYPKCSVVISTVGMPEDIEKLNILKVFLDSPAKAPKVALLNCRDRKMEKLMLGGFLTAIIHFDPNKKYSMDAPDPENLDKTFAMRYLLITKKNLKQMKKQFPRNIFFPPQTAETEKTGK